MKIDVVILTRNELSYTKQCLESLVENTEIDFNLIHMDNASTDGTSDWVESFCKDKQVNLIQTRYPENQYLCKAMNGGIKSSVSEVLVIINNDIIFTPKAVDYLVQPLLERKGLWSVGSNTLYAIPENFPNNKDRKERAMQMFCFGARKELFDKVGLLDEKIRFWHADRDFLQRLKALEINPIFVPESYVHHFVSRTLVNLERLGEIKQEDHAYYITKHKSLRFDLWDYVQVPGGNIDNLIKK